MIGLVVYIKLPHKFVHFGEGPKLRMSEYTHTAGLVVLMVTVLYGFVKHI